MALAWEIARPNEWCVWAEAACVTWGLGVQDVNVQGGKR